MYENYFSKDNIYMTKENGIWKVYSLSGNDISTKCKRSDKTNLGYLLLWNFLVSQSNPLTNEST